ncbi:MAG: ATP-dependent metallopeptidase FtsH/Yme1/Tma family protein [Planctomycetota bacterium]
MTNGKSKKPAPPRPGPDPRGEKKPPLPSYRRGPLSWLIIAVVVFTALMMLKQWRSIENINYDDFERYIRNNEIESVEIGETEITGKFNQKGIDARAEKASISFAVDYNPDVVGDRLTTLLADSDVKWKFAKQHIWLPFLLSWLLPLLVLLAIIYFFLARPLRGGAGGMLMSFGRSKHRVQGKDRVKVTFKDVAGVEEAKEEVAEIIEFFEKPEKIPEAGRPYPSRCLAYRPTGLWKNIACKSHSRPG